MKDIIVTGNVGLPEKDVIAPNRAELIGLVAPIMNNLAKV